jgi:membrane-associated phospholipid phosphatase
MNKILSQLGYFGPLTLFIQLNALMVKHGISSPMSYLAVLAWQILSLELNHVLKILIRKPRPDGGVSVNFLDRLDSNDYGMPSGHAQQVFSEFTFIALAFRDKSATIFAAAQSLLTLAQRYSHKKHNVRQLLVGAAVGVAVGWGFYKVARDFVLK